ncbi:transposase [Roseiflexus sp.]
MVSYPPDLTDAEWRRIAPSLLERTSLQGRHRVHSSRAMVHAIVSVVRRGCARRRSVERPLTGLKRIVACVRTTKHSPIPVKRSWMR